MKNIVTIIQIAMLILDLIRDGLSENEITEDVMSNFGVPKEFVKRFL